MAAVPVYSSALKNHASPYLAMHGNDPVHWSEWNEAALQKARKENKLLFVSIGYFACHWCHVMHRESFSNPEIAKKLNTDYISIKVDRELNPVLDKRLIDFVSATNGSAGWPLNVFITPDGDPLVGATYIPPEAFSQALTNLAKQWKKDSKTLKAEAKILNEKLHAALNGQEVDGSKAHIADSSTKFIEEVMSTADTLDGGVGEQMKFPTSPQLHTLFKLNRKNKDPKVDQFIKLTLDAMSTKGLHDEIGGGFYRYTVDPGWNTPHFEKMLYNNAMLTIFYFDAADYYDVKAYRHTALETLYFLNEAMKGQSGAFIASLSAVDNNGVEGGYYLWTQAELKKILTPAELKLANTAWKMNRTAELDAGILPMMQISIEEVMEKLGLTKSQVKQQLTLLRNKLKLYRNENRGLPRDFKLLTGWNGLALAAFAKGLKHDLTLKPHGQQLAKFLRSMWNGKQIQRAANSHKAGTLNDYAAAAWGLLSWAKATNDPVSKKMGILYANYAWEHFYINNKWQEDENPLLPEGVQASHLADGPSPSAETLLLRASFLADTSELLTKAHEVMGRSSKSIEHSPYSYASLIAVANRYKKP